MTVETGTIGRWQGAGLMATTLLGTGVFILPQITVEKAGIGALFAWVALTLAIIPVTLVFARLASVLPHAAGPAYFVEKAFGRVLGRTVGLLFLFVVPFGAPAAILMTFQFVNALMPVHGWAKVSMELGVIAMLWLLNLRGIQVSAKLQFGLTLAIVSVVVILMGGAAIEPAGLIPLSEHAPAQLPLVLTAAGIAFWSFLGVEAMTHLANDFKNPEKDMIPAMMMGTVLVGIIYVSCALLILWTPTVDGVAMISAFDHLFGGYGAEVIGILGISSGLATVNIYAASASRLLWSFSQNGLLPSYFEKRNQHNVPLRALTAILAAMAVIIVLTFIGGQQLEHLIAWTNGVFVIIYSMSMLAAVKLLPQQNKLLISAAIGFCIAMAIALGSNMLYSGCLMLFILLVVKWQSRAKA